MTDEAGTPAVRVRGLDKTYGRKQKVHALRGVDLDIAEGELLVLLGPSGCGKSTMLRALAGLERPSGGSIELGGEVMSDAATGTHRPANKRDIGLVFQTYVLWPHMTVRQNVEYPLRARHLRDDLRSGRAGEMLRIVQCDHLADRHPNELSGGQQQRVALARALAARPQLMLLDEPLSNLDALLRISLRAQLREIHRILGYTGVYVTHDQAEALSLGDRIAVMEHGRIAQIAEPRELFEHPATEYVADFLGVRNSVPVRLDGTVPGRDDAHVVGGWAAGMPSGEHHLYFRPQSIRLLPPGRGAPDGGGADGALLHGGRVSEVLYGGTESEYVIDHAGRRLFATTPGVQPFDVGDEVTLFVGLDGLLVYDAEHRLVDVNASRSSRGAAG